MISIGDTNQFAIQCEFTAEEKGWIFGRFRFVLRNKCCGDWNDETDLRGCASWLLDFVENPRNRYEPDLLTLPAIEVFDRTVKSVMGSAPGEHRSTELYPNTFSRFHISHLGMSSFNCFTVILIEDQFQQRCLWRKVTSSEIHDCRFESGLMQSVARGFCQQLIKEIGDFGLFL
jgi:hypothetical protein